MNYLQHKCLALLTVVSILFGFTACQDEGYEDVTGTASQNLWEVINSRSDLSQFADVLRQNGYDKVLSSAGTFTVFAPGNSQVSAVASDKRSQVPGAHIARLAYNKATLADMTYVTMINDRKALISDLALTDDEIVCRNGFLRFSKAEARATQLNIYEQLFALSDKYEMAAFITSLGDSMMDVERSVQIGIDPVTYRPVYDTIKTYYNPLFEYVPLNDNDSLMSLVLVDNETWRALKNRYWRYMRQHVDGSKNPALLDPMKDSSFGYGQKFDTLATDSVTCLQLVRDLSCSYEGAVIRPSLNNPESVGSVYLARTGVEITMDQAVIADTIMAANGRIELASGVKIKLANNKIKDVYVEAEDYYYTNERYVATLVDPRFRGSRYVKTYGIDSLRRYTRYVLDESGQRAKRIDGTDSTEVVDTKLYYVYNTSQYCNSFGGSVLGYKVPLFSCNYRVQWRHVVPGNQGINYCNPDTLDINYSKYAANPNWPIGGVMRHIQKMYLSQPGDLPLEYSQDLANNDFVLHPYPYTTYGSYSWYRCMTDYDPEAVISNSATDEVGCKGPINWYRMGVNAGYGIDDPNFETPLIWCQTAMDHANGVININPDTGEAAGAVYTSGIVGVSTVTSWIPKDGAQQGNVAPRRVPRDIFMCLYNGEATVFVTSNPFGTDNAAGAANLKSCKGSIFLDYIHFIPVIDEDD